MAKAKKPYPGMGPFVILLKANTADEFWELAEGANSEEAARKKARNWTRHAERKIVTNSPGDPKETRY